MKYTLLILALVAQSAAQTSVQTSASVEQGAIAIDVERYPTGSPYCGATCTWIDYTYCLNETIGCLSGWQYAYGEPLKGNVGASWINGAVITLDPSWFESGNAAGEAWTCNAWQGSDTGDCIDQVDIPLSAGIIGDVSMVWTKVPISAQLTSQINLQPGTTSTVICDTFTANAVGSITQGMTETPISAAGFLVFYETETKANAVVAPAAALDSLAGKLSPAAIRQLKAIEARRLAK
jgi:hypothetical protein